MRRNRPNYYAVLLNGEHVADLQTATKAEAKQWIKDHVLSTHMGEWCKTKNGIEYATTIGRYYQFVKLPKTK